VYVNVFLYPVFYVGFTKSSINTLNCLFAATSPTQFHESWERNQGNRTLLRYTLL